MQTCLEEGLLLYPMWMNVVQNTANHGSSDSRNAVGLQGCRAAMLFSQLHSIFCCLECNRKLLMPYRAWAKGAREKG